MTLAAALAVTVCLLPLVRRGALSLRLVDWPGGRKAHRTPVPRLGGIAVAAGALTGVLVTVATRGDPGPDHPPAYLGLLLGVGIVFLVGLVDDLRGLGPAPRVVGELIAGALVATSGLAIEVIHIPGVGAVELGVLAVPVTALWCLAVTNAFNLTDGLDGLLSLVSIPIFGGCLALALGRGDVVVAGVSVAAIGALAGFLVWNWHPARIFLGDSGSLVLGFAAAVCSLAVARQPNQGVSPGVMLLLCALPVAETGLTLARRFINGQPYFCGDHSHIHHVLVKSGLSIPRTVVALAAAQAIFSAVAVLYATWRNPATIALIAGLLIAALLGLRALCYVELEVAWRRFGAFFVVRPRRNLASIVAVARAGGIVKVATNAADLRDRLRVAVVEGRLTFLAVELGAEARAILGAAESAIECRNDVAARYVEGRGRGVVWLFSRESFALEHGAPGCASVRHEMPIGPDGRLGTLVCHAFYEPGAPAAPEHEVRTYLVGAVEEAILRLASPADSDGLEGAGAYDVGLVSGRALRGPVVNS